MLFFRNPTRKNFIRHRFNIPTNEAITLVPIIERLLADHTDGDAFQQALRPFFNGERPRIAIISGHDVTLYVEGPRYVCGDKSYPLGAQLFLANLGWINVGPVETAELQTRLAASIDATVFRWLGEQGDNTAVHSCRVPRERPLEDEIALRQMAAAASRDLAENQVPHD